MSAEAVDAAARPRASTGRALAIWVPRLTILVFLGPVVAGLVGTLLPAFGVLPAIGAAAPGLGAFRDLLATPGIGTAIRLTLSTGFAATLVSLALAVAIAAAWHGLRRMATLRGLLPLVLAIPHVALAFALAFVMAPAGFLARLLSPWATGWATPPDVPTVGDPWGIAMVLGLLPKETGFLLLMIAVALGQVRARRTLAVATGLGYGPVAAWLKVVFPQVWPQIRLPVYAVLAYALSVVDVALVLGPQNPPTLAVLVTRWFQHPDLAMQLKAAAGATLQIVLVAGSIGLFRLGEIAVARLARGWLTGGARGGDGRASRRVLTALAVAAGAVVTLAFAGLALWSVARGWFYPAAFPATLTLGTWERAADDLARPAGTTVLVGVAATVVATVLVAACLEAERAIDRRRVRRGLLLVYVPLLVPQVGFLFGVQVLFVRLGIDGTLFAVAWAHLAYVLPYVFLALADPWRAFDDRYRRTAAALGRGPLATFLTVTLPMLLTPLLVAAAIGFAVSVDQYLPTLFAGAGRVATLTTEALSLSAGGDRRVIAVYALLLAALPAAVFLAAIALPAVLWRRRQGMQQR